MILSDKDINFPKMDNSLRLELNFKKPCKEMHMLGESKTRKNLAANLIHDPYRIVYTYCLYQDPLVNEN